jgi:hypothetical protein
MTGGLPAGPLAAARGDLSYVVWLLVACGALVALSLAAFLLISWLRRRALRDEPAAGPAFTMESLEELRRSGQLSDDEYRALRRQVLGLPPAGAAEGSISSSPPAGVDGQTDRPPEQRGKSEES